MANEFARRRDCFGSVGTSCISCGRWCSYEELDGGHFIPTTSSAIRFHEDNIHAQCRRCNRFLHGNPRHYLRGLERKIGKKRVGYLESKEFETKKWSREELAALEEYYRGKLTAISRGEDPRTSEDNQGLEMQDLFKAVGETDKR